MQLEKDPKLVTLLLAHAGVFDDCKSWLGTPRVFEQIVPASKVHSFHQTDFRLGESGGQET